VGPRGVHFAPALCAPDSTSGKCCLKRGFRPGGPPGRGGAPPAPVTSPQRNKVLIGSGSSSPGAGTVALPVAPIALTQNGEYRHGRQYICAGGMQAREAGQVTNLWDTATEGGTRPGRASVFLKQGGGGMRTHYQRVATPKPQGRGKLEPRARSTDGEFAGTPTNLEPVSTSSPLAARGAPQVPEVRQARTPSPPRRPAQI